ncbi:Nucleoside-diphosphate-sugar epimerase [Halopseudomonas xinjiangensis]|uniref:Nucleoside-diphosphate-sugar epimerase n=1 Tax=Halopseudomonas xinjiangensis TaxID=487184 RepID=A0A1H1XI47_9GAMM|nr:NAD-dependent epimerase/dehydratase family protein [Halopseudomonas xinjiangensis]SDT08386.1 Nucleoside-diphosphate-sugar epimerase [Halopseudomonas xinjiangensis]
MRQVVIAGCGDLGSALAERLMARGWAVHGLRRDVSRLPEGVLPVAGDLTRAECPEAWPRKVDYLVYCPAAGKRDAELYQQLYVAGLRNLVGWMRERRQQARHLLQVSSTGVYGQTQGEWVTENSPALAGSETARVLIEAEDVALRSGMPASVVRLAGIYGPGRNRLIDQVRAGVSVPAEPPQYSNRIHRDDAAGLLEHLLLEAENGELLAPCYLGVDDEPAPLHAVCSWLAEQLGTSLQPDGREIGRVGSKRCSNELARESGWEPVYPSYREGYAAMLNAV